MKIVRNIDCGSDTHAIIMSLSVLRRPAWQQALSVSALHTMFPEIRCHLARVPLKRHAGKFYLTAQPITGHSEAPADAC